ncbi:arrestin domain-containing protein 3-like [Chironomus tepperi]|uniref:arrestin domain-containing protein 3-like n=1 Tax=Chironomus tepperi TaxID=113505 RepID=UPI00391F2F05
MANINIHLEPNVDGTFFYFPGHILKGNVELVLDHTKKFRGFYIQVFGKAKCQWTQGSGKNSHTYTGTEVYVNSRTYLFGEYGGPTFEMEAGTYKYKFQCQLPHQLPYSLSLPHGKVSYHIEAVLDIPWKIDKETKLDITILRYDDLNLYPELKNPMRRAERKNFITLFSDSKPLLMTAGIPCRGFAINQVVPVTIEYENESSVDIACTKIKLIQMIVYNSPQQSKTKEKEEVIIEARGEGVLAAHSKTLQAALTIPKVINSNDKFCQVVTVTYCIEVEAESTGLHTNHKIRLPITIGTVPLTFDNQYSPAQVTKPSAPEEEPYSYDKPPSYGETMQML